MCAIAGLIGIPYTPEILSVLLETMRHRGPDGEGVYIDDGAALLHTRLAIIDPSGGQQPMTLAWKGEVYTITYNGELYNTKEVRNELLRLDHQFCSHSDTEVLLHAYAQWGMESLSKLNGIYAFGVWEHKRKRLFVARDRIGVKPFFYCIKKKGMIFSSEIKTLLAHPDIPAELDAQGIGELLLLGPGRTPGSGVLKNVLELKPGYCGYFEDGRLDLIQYWRLTDREHTDSLEETAEKVRWLVTDAICRQTVSDVPLGTFLSGGLDSSLISAVCADHMGELKTFSVDYLRNALYFKPGKFQPNSDGSYIQLMVDALHSEHNNTVLTSEQLVDALEPATHARDLPGMADVDFSLLLLCRDIRSRVKVALSGECADEIFGGYPWYRDPEVRQKNGFPWAQNTAYRAGFLNKEHRSKLSPVEFVQDRYRQTIRESDILPGTSPLERRMKEMVNLNQHWFMQTLLDRKDRMSMACGLEVRVPFCDHRIAEYLYTVPWEYKDHGGREKGLLRKAMEGVLPEEVLYRKKSPYPKTYDPKYMTLVSERLKQLLLEPQAPILQIVDIDALKALLDAEYEWPWYGQLMKVPQTISYMLQIDHWMRHYHVKVV